MLQVQEAKVELPVDVLEFAGQARHIDVDEAPTDVEYVPAPQSLQMTDPFDDLYFPATHVMQGPPLGPDDPMLQVQAANDEAPADELELTGQLKHMDDDPVEYVPAPQSMQMADPVDALYFPETHAVHVLPSDPEEPALQVHAVTTVLPAGALEVSAVKSTPRTMRPAMAKVVSALRYSSTTKTPAMSPLNSLPGVMKLLPM
jgi:hypothetical protein